MMKFTLRIAIILLALLALAAPAAAQIACPGTLPSRLAAGQQGRVTPGAPNRVRDLPTTAGTRIGEIPGGAVFTVLEGPTCADGYAWWRVNYDGLVGWTAEAGLEYWLEPMPLTIPGANVPIMIDFQGVRFVMDSALATSVTAQVLPEVIHAFGYPRRVEFTFADWGVDDLNATITIFAVADLVRLDRGAQADLDRLAGLLESGISQGILDEDPLDYNLPVMAAQPYQARPQIVPFTNGAGIRYLTQFAQDLAGPTRTSTRYIFQGLTSDGQMFISADLPVEIDLYPEFFDYGGLDYDDFAANYPEYLQQVVADMNAHPPEAFNPALERIDALFASMTVAEVPGQSVTYDGVSFFLAEAVAQQSEGAFVSQFQAQSGDDSGLFAVAVDHLRFIFEGFNSAAYFRELRVYPTAAFEDAIGLSLDSLRDTLTSQSQSPSIPYGVPLVNAARVFEAQPALVSFQNGLGVRYLAHFSQGFMPVDLTYVFLGLTSDDAYFVQALFTVDSPLLAAPQLQAYLRLDADSFVDQYENYLTEVINLISSAADTSFSPTLTEVDALISTLLVEPQILGP